VPSSTVNVCNSSGCLASGATGSSGSVTLSNIPAGSYTVYAFDRSSNTSMSQSATVSANAAASVSFDFPVTCASLTGGS
jgi:hypothetical protein